MKHCPMRHLVDRHFEGGNRPEQELRLREHLSSCDECHRYYERHQLFSGLDPWAMPAEQRLARALGLLGPSAAWHGRRASVPLAPLVLAGVAAACLGLFLLRPSGRAPEFVARGAAAAPRVWAYRIAPDGKANALEDFMAASDELAFAYDVPDNDERLLIFGVDEHRHVVWYHPAWTEPATSPVAVPIASGRHELPEAVSHALDGVELTLYAVFTDQPITVRDVEQTIASDEGTFTKSAAWKQRLRVIR